MSEFTKNLLIDIIIAVIVAGTILFFIRPTVVQQTSMLPTFTEGDYVITYKRAYKHKDPARGDVIIFQSSMTDEKGKDKLLIKRVIGLPGDVLSIEDGMVYINGKEYEEDYTLDGYTNGQIIDYVVPEDSFFCMGDNRLASIDSRSAEVGPVSRDSIKGKVVIRLFPFSKFGTDF